MQSFIVQASLGFKLAGGGGCQNDPLSPLRYKERLSPLRVNDNDYDVVLFQILTGD